MDLDKNIGIEELHVADAPRGAFTKLTDELGAALDIRAIGSYAEDLRDKKYPTLLLALCECASLWSMLRWLPCQKARHLFCNTKRQIIRKVINNLNEIE